MRVKQNINPLNQFAKRIIKASDKFIEYADTHAISSDAQQLTSRVSALATDLERFVSGEPGAAPAKRWTVIGFYEATGETFTHRVTVSADGSASDAIAAVAGKLKGDLSNIAILGAFAGACAFTPSCEDSGNMAYACDLKEQ